MGRHSRPLPFFREAHMIGKININSIEDATLVVVALRKMIPDFEAQPRKQATLRRMLEEAKSIMQNVTVH